MTENNEHPPTTPSSSPAPSRSGVKTQIPPSIRTEIVQLHAYYGSREIAHRIRLSRKIVRRILSEEGCLEKPSPLSPASKLEPFHPMIKGRVAKGLTVSRILREIREQGYTGGRSILATYVQTLQSSLSPSSRKTVKRRFETSLGEDYGKDGIMVRRRAKNVFRQSLDIETRCVS